MSYQTYPDIALAIIIFPSKVVQGSQNLLHASEHWILISHPSELSPNLLLVHHDSILLSVANTCYLIDNAIRMTKK